MVLKNLYNNLPSFYQKYLDCVATNNLLAELETSKIITEDIFKQIPKQLENFSYEENKWNIKEVFRHIIDCERIFVYRAFRFSRLDNTELAGFDENHYIEKIKGYELDLNDLQEDYLSVRQSTICMFKSLNAQMLDYVGTANNVAFSARILGLITVGHNLHHCNIIKTKYLI